MNKTTTLLAVLTTLLCFEGLAQGVKTTLTKDQILVKSSISDTIIDNSSMQLIKYEASKTIDVNYHACVSLLKEVNNYKQLFDYTERSEKVKEMATNEWLIYFYLDMPWPMSNSDAVYRMKITENEKITQIEMVSTPDLMEYTDVKRGQVGHSIYLVEQLDNGKVFLKIKTLSVPVNESPDWMVKAWFPDGPADIIRKIEKLASTQ